MPLLDLVPFLVIKTEVGRFGLIYA